jgi:hypothetical protein
MSIEKVLVPPTKKSVVFVVIAIGFHAAAALRRRCILQAIFHGIKACRQNTSVRIFT